MSTMFILPTRTATVALLGWILVTLAIDSLKAAPPTAVPTPTPTPTPQVSEIGIVYVVSQIEQSLSSLKDTQDQLSNNLQQAQAVAATLPDLNKNIRERVAADTILLESSPSLYSLERSQLAWQALGNTVSTAQLKLTDNVNQANSSLQQLKDLDKVWQTTLRTAKPGGAPPEVITRIQSLLTTIDQTSKNALSVQAQILAIQTKLSDQNSSINSGSDNITKAQVIARAKLLEQDHAPLWIDSTASDRSAMLSQENNSLADQVQIAQTYLAERINIVAIHFVVWAFMIILLHWVRHSVPKEVDTDVLHMPVVIASLFAIIASVWLYPLAPRLLSSAVGAIAIIPTVIILRRLVEPLLFPILYAIVLSYFVDQFRNVLTPTGTASRFIFVFEILACCVFLLWLQKSKRLKQTSVILYVNITFFGLIIAGFANVFGYVHLAELVGNGTLFSAYLTLIFYSAVLVLELLIASSFRMYPLVMLKMFKTHREIIYLKVSSAIRRFALAGWAYAAMTRFSIQDTVIQGVKAVLDTNIYWGWLTVPIGPLLAAGLTIWIAFRLSRFAQFVLQQEIYPVVKLGRGVPYIASKYVHYAILTIGFLTAVEALGIDLTKFSLIGGAIGVGLGLAVQAPIAHFVSGVLLLFERSIKVGDSIQIDSTGVNGVVEQVGIRASVVRTPTGSHVILPNSTLIANPVISWSLNSQRLIEIPLTVSPKADLRQVMDLLLNIAASSDKILKTPPPQALLISVAGAALTFRLRVWVATDVDSLAVASDLSMAIGSALVKENIPLN